MHVGLHVSTSDAPGRISYMASPHRGTLPARQRGGSLDPLMANQRCRIAVDRPKSDGSLLGAMAHAHTHQRPRSTTPAGAAVDPARPAGAPAACCCLGPPGAPGCCATSAHTAVTLPSPQRRASSSQQAQCNTQLPCSAPPAVPPPGAWARPPASRASPVPWSPCQRPCPGCLSFPTPAAPHAPPAASHGAARSQEAAAGPALVNAARLGPAAPAGGAAFSAHPPALTPSPPILVLLPSSNARTDVLDGRAGQPGGAGQRRPQG